MNSQKGFTIGELLVAICIMAALSVISIIGIAHLKKELSLKKADDTAKNLYVAMENRLNDLRWNGSWKTVIKDEKINLGTRICEKPSDFDYWVKTLNASDHVYSVYDFSDNGSFFYLNSNDTDDLRLINEYFLPFGSIEEDVRLGSNYYIEYNPYTASVYSIIYIEGNLDVPYEELVDYMNNYGRTRENLNENEARHYRGEYIYDGNNLIIGYYGGGISMDIKTIELKDPVINVINGDDLIINVENNNDVDIEIYVEITGITSQKKYKCYFDIDKRKMIYGLSTIDTDLYLKTHDLDEYKNLYKVYDLDSGFNFVLDSISDLYTSEYKNVNMHFMNNFPKMIPGEDVEIKVTFWPTNDYYALPKTNTIIINSLFNDVREDSATISCMRHLENLSTDISGINSAQLYGIENLNDLNIEKVFLINDISYLGIDKKRNYNEFSGITDLNGKVYHSYFPINNTNINYIQGNSHRITDLTIDIMELSYIGLFGNVNQIEIFNLGLIANSNNLETPLYLVGENNKYIGSFIGNCKDVKLKNCFSTTRIISQCEMYSGDLYVGGLIGKTDNSCSIESCYTGGFAPDGFYDIDKGNISLLLDENNAYIGGFVGLTGGLNSKISKSYSNQSIFCGDYNENSSFFIGGLIGYNLCHNICNISSSYHCAPIITPLYFSDPDLENVEYIVGGLVGYNNAICETISDAWYIDSFFAYSQSYIEPDADDIKISISKAKKYTGSNNLLTYPISENLNSLSYPYPEVTGLGHHFGDWQDKVPNIHVKIDIGHGVEGVNNNTTLLEYGDQINLSKLGIKLKKGYDDPAIIISIKDNIVYKGNTNYIWKAGLFDVIISVYATTILPPDLNLSSTGNYVFGYDNGLITADYLGNHCLNGDISLHYEIGYLDEKSKLIVIEESDWKLKDNAYISIINIDSTEYVGTRTYYITAYAFDGLLQSKSSEKTYIEILYKKIRQPIRFYSGGGWFYD